MSSTWNRLFLSIVSAIVFVNGADAQILNKQEQLERQTFWDNRDWDWYANNIPFFECPDSDITTTYYYRWELLTKHLTYGSPNSGYSFTEFIDRPFWSGAYGAISCPAGHQLYEARWLKDKAISRDYARYWFRTPGAQPRNYSTWLADSIWAINQVQDCPDFAIDLLPDLVANYEAWEQRHFVPAVGLFWQTGHDDGMEFNINSRQTKDILRGAPSYRPSFNAYMWADAKAIAHVAKIAGRADIAERFELKAAALKERMQALLWDPKRKFFFPMYRDDEERDGHKIKAGSLTYQTGQFAGNPHGREQIGFVPWQFEMLDSDRGFDEAWKTLMDPDYFYAEFGPTTVERKDPMFLLQKSCCWWSGQSWPYATSQTLKAMANLLQSKTSDVVDSEDYYRLLKIFAKTHRKQGVPYLAEACDPDTGSFEGHDGYNHSEHYFHSSFCDQVITGLVGLRPSHSDKVVIHPLAPKTWDWFALDDLAYRGRCLSIIWDRDGSRYQRGTGLIVSADGVVIAKADKLEPITVELPEVKESDVTDTKQRDVNFAVNNDGTYYPKLTTSFASTEFPSGKLNDGNIWYARHPPNRWTSEGSKADSDWIEVDFGAPRSIHTIKLYFLDDEGKDGSIVASPSQIELEQFVNGQWQKIVDTAVIQNVEGHRATVVDFRPVAVTKFRVTIQHRTGKASGLSEIEAWGTTALPVETVMPPSGNLAFRKGDAEYPKASSSFHDRFGGRPENANDGKTVFLPTPMNRWTSYESKSSEDWLEIDFGKLTEFQRVELAIYDDRGGVQRPRSYRIEWWDGKKWNAVDQARYSPAKPVGGQWNEVRFAAVKANKMRIVFENAEPAKSGVTEVQVWND